MYSETVKDKWLQIKQTFSENYPNCSNPNKSVPAPQVFKKAFP